MFLVALTGGIAAGKSSVAAEFARLGARVIDADAVAREVVEPGMPALAEIRSAFGSGVLGADGALDRAQLGSIVFADPDQLKKLNGIVHPAVRSRVRNLLADIQRDDPDAIVVYDVPLLIEAQVDHAWDMVVVVMASAEARVRRLMQERGIDEEQARLRIQRQTTDDQRLEAADVVIHAETSMDDTLQQARDVWKLIQKAQLGRA